MSEQDGFSFLANKTILRRMDDVRAYEQAVRDAPTLRICLMSLLAFAFHRSDYLMVAAIEQLLEKPLGMAHARTVPAHDLERALRDKVGDTELIWWLKMAQMAQSDVKCRAVFSRLARQRISP